MPGSRAHRRLAGRLRDAQGSGAPRGHRPRPTFPARWPVLRLDHVFLSREVEALKIEVRRGPLERVASDHLPLCVDIAVRASPSSG